MPNREIAGQMCTPEAGHVLSAVRSFQLDMPDQAHFSVTFVRNIVHYAVARGVEMQHLCQVADFPRLSLSNPDGMMDGVTAGRVWQAALAETGDPHMGLHSGEIVQPADLGLLGFAMMSSETLQSALDKLARYWNLMTNATLIKPTLAANSAILELRVLDLPGNFLLRNRHPVESSMAAGLAIARSLVGRRLPLVDAASIYPAPSDTREYERVFGRRLRFGAETNLISFDAAALRLPVLHTNPSLASALEDQLERRVQQNATTVRDRVRRELAQALRGEVPGLAEVAQALTMSERALQRDLQLEGTSFRMVLDDLRRDLALEYLRDARHSIADISFLLGFSEPSVLHRYFRRWLGMTPQEYRRNLGTGAVPQHQPA